MTHGSQAGEQGRGEAGGVAAGGMLDRFDVVLGLTGSSLVILSLVDLSEPFDDPRALVGALAVTGLLGATMILVLRASGIRRRSRRPWEVLIVVTVAMFMLLLVGHVVLEDPIVVDVTDSPRVFWAVLTAAAPAVVVRRLLHHEMVTRQTLFGALSGYLLIAVALSFAFHAIGVLQSVPFFGTEQPSTTFMYYSLVTVTTVGYGDFAAVTPLGRLASVVGAVLGQVYLVTVVAMVVSLLARRRGSG